MKVRANKFYMFVPAGWDVFDPKTTLVAGALVKVVNLHGCPPCNTMGQCHVADHDGRFMGLVSTASLQPLPVHRPVRVRRGKVVGVMFMRAGLHPLYRS